jgi:glycine betaine/proline transport system ATP-binding protein
VYKLRVEELYKIFGHKPKRAIPMLEKGMAKEEILDDIGCTVAVDNVSLNIKRGEIFVIMGLSGSGKSTLLRCLNRLFEPTLGNVFIDETNLTQADDDQLREVRSKKMSMVFQHFGLLPHKTVSENVAFGLELQGVDKERRMIKAYETIEQVGLKGYEEMMTAELSGGMQQRVGLARALATDPEILLMDEAFSALDPLIRSQMQDELLDLQGKMHKTIVFITHDLDEALKLGDRIAIMKDGRIVQIGTSEEILTEPANDYVEAFVENVDRSKVITASSLMFQHPERILAPKDGPEFAIRKMRNLGVMTIPVTDSKRHFKGLVHIDEAVKVKKKNHHNLFECIDSDAPTASPDTPVVDLLPMAWDKNTPISVLNDNGQLVGLITPSSIVAEISGEEINGGKENNDDRP